jgi:hypothetical protein
MCQFRDAAALQRKIFSIGQRDYGALLQVAKESIRFWQVA